MKLFVLSRRYVISMLFSSVFFIDVKVEQFALFVYLYDIGDYIFLYVSIVMKFACYLSNDAFYFYFRSRQSKRHFPYYFLIKICNSLERIQFNVFLSPYILKHIVQLMERLERGNLHDILLPHDI